MNKHLLSLDSMKTITSWPSDATQCQILRSLSLSKALHHPVKRNEKKELREVHKTDIIKFKISKSLSKFTVQDESQKSFILLQAIISQHEFQNKTLKQEMSSVTNAATKILQAAHEYCIKSSKCGTVAKECFLLHRSLIVCLWGVDSGVLNQIDGIGLSCVRMLRIHAIQSFQHVLDSTEEQIEKAAGRRFPFGKELKNTVKDLMRDNLKLSAQIEYTRNSGRPASLVVTLKAPSDPSGPILMQKPDPTVSFTIIAYTDIQNESILFVEQGVSKPTSVRVPLPQRFGKVYVCKLASIVGLDESLTLNQKQDLPRNESSKTPIAEVKALVVDPSAVSAIRAGRVRQSKQPTMIFNPSKSLKMTPSKSDPVQLDPSPTYAPNRVDALNLGENMVARATGDPSCERIVSKNHNHESSPFAAASWHLRDATSQSPMHVTPTTNIASTQTPPTDPHLFRKPRSFVHLFDGSQQINSSDKEGVANFWNTSKHNNNAQSLLAENLSHTVANQWNKTLQRTSQSQKRAFTGKKENPFKAFSHDPNDSEGRLKKLACRQRQFSSKQFKRMKDPRFERRAPRMDARDLMKGYADELERDRQRRLAHQQDPHYSLSQSDHRYSTWFDHGVPPNGPTHSSPPEKSWRYGYSPLESSDYRQDPRHYVSHSTKVLEHEAQFHRPLRQFNRNFPPPDSFVDSKASNEPYGTFQANIRHLWTGGGTYPGSFEREQPDRWAF
jgi:hypothetical protein